MWIFLLVLFGPFILLCLLNLAFCRERTIIGKIVSSRYAYVMSFLDYTGRVTLITFLNSDGKECHFSIVGYNDELNGGQSVELHYDVDRLYESWEEEIVSHRDGSRSVERKFIRWDKINSYRILDSH